VLIPVIPDCVLSQDAEQGLITIHVMKGLV
jgi:hypothetical protein